MTEFSVTFPLVLNIRLGHPTEYIILYNLYFSSIFTAPDTTPVHPQLLLTEFVILSSSLSAAVGIPTDADAINKSSTPLADFADTFIC